MNDPVSIVDHRTSVEVTQPIEMSSRPVTPLASDLWIYRFAISTLGALALLSLGGSLVLTALGHDAPQVTVALGSAAVGALAGLLTPSPSRA
jgi:hypothetical protein